DWRYQILLIVGTGEGYYSFYALEEQKVFSLLLLGPSGVGKTEVAKILSGAIASNQPLPKINLGNYSSKDSLNSLIGSPRGYVGSEEGELGRKLDSSKAGVLLVDEFEKAEPAVWNFFLDLLETGTYTDSQGREHDLGGYVIVFTTNCPREHLETTFPAELLSRFSLIAHFVRLNHDEKEKIVERYVSGIADAYKKLSNRSWPPLPENIAERALQEIDVDGIDNIRILKNVARSWLTSFVEGL
ncbi:AAA family ATPase, partial [Raoultibacter massiliensis]